MAEFSSRRHRLAREIACELDQLARVADISRRLSALSEADRRPWDAAAASKYVADLFLGFENLCKRRYRYLNLPLPSGPNYHSDILTDFLDEATLGGALSNAVVERLKKYLRFRHRFSHGYGYDVSWEIAEEPLRLLPETVELLSNIWQTWLDNLPAETG
jgi:hypothetical protein